MPTAALDGLQYANKLPGCMERSGDESNRQSQGNPSGSMCEILVGGEQDKLVLDAKLRDERIHRTQLHAATSARIAQLCCSHMSVARGLNQGQCLKVLEAAGLILGAVETLQEFLQHDAGDDDGIAIQQCALKNGDRRMIRPTVAPQRQ